MRVSYWLHTGAVGAGRRSWPWRAAGVWHVCCIVLCCFRVDRYAPRPADSSNIPPCHDVGFIATRRWQSCGSAWKSMLGRPLQFGPTARYDACGAKARMHARCCCCLCLHQRRLNSLPEIGWFDSWSVCVCVCVCVCVRWMLRTGMAGPRVDVEVQGQ